MANNSQNNEECSRTRSNKTTTSNSSRTRQNAQSKNSRSMTNQTNQSAYYSRQPTPIQPPTRGPNIVPARQIDNPNFTTDNYAEYGYDEAAFNETASCRRCPKFTRPSPATIRTNRQTDDPSGCGGNRACRPQIVVDKKETASNKSYVSCGNSSPCKSPERSYAPSQTSPRSDWNHSPTTDNCDMCCSEGDLDVQSFSSEENTNDICGRKQYQPNAVTQNSIPTMEQIYRDEDSILTAEVIARNFNLDEFLARERSAQAKNRALTWNSEYSVTDSSRMNSTGYKSQNSQTLNSSIEPSSPQMSSTMKRQRSPIIVVPRQGLNDYVNWRLRANNDRTDSSMQSTMRSPMPKRSASQQRSKQNPDGYSTSYSYVEPTDPSCQSLMRDPQGFSPVVPSRQDTRRNRARDTTDYDFSRDFSGPQMNSTMKEPPQTNIMSCCGSVPNDTLDTYSRPQMSSTMKPPPCGEVVLPYCGNVTNETMNYPGTPQMHSTMRAPMNDTIVMPRGNPPRDVTETTWCSDRSESAPGSPYSPGSPKSPNSPDSLSGAAYDCSKSANSRKCPPAPGENLDPDCVRKMLVSQLDHLVKDSYCPGIIQDTMNGCENFNTIAFDLVFGENGFVPECAPAVEPITLLEAFYVRVDMERVQMNKTKCCRSAKQDDDDEFGLSMIDDHFNKLYNTELNQAISDLLKAETIAEILEEEVSDAPTFTLEMSKGETLLPGGKPVMITAYTGTTAPKDV